MAAKKEQTANVDSLQLSLRLNRDRLETHLKVLGDVLGDSPSNTVQDIAAKTSKSPSTNESSFRN